MKPSARIQTSIEVLNILKQKKIPMDLIIGDYMRNRRYIGSKDRANVVERVYGMMRVHARLGWWVNKVKLEDTPRNRSLLFGVLTEDHDDKRLKDLHDGTKYAPEPLTDEEIKAIKPAIGQPLEHKDMPLEVKTETPDHYAESLKAYFGEGFEDEMNALIKGATLDLRVNSFTATREKVLNYLEADGVKAEESPYSPWGLRVQGKTYLSRTKAFGKRWIEIQDEGSQLIALACAAAPGMQVLDYCAGAGGKTLALAAMMQKKGRIVAMDLDERRLNKGKLRFKKSGLADIIEVRPLSDDKNRKWLRRQKGTFDVVLCDVPCTGTGTWRRNPDMRWNTYGPDLAELVTIQAEILDKVAHVAKPGGKLVYATCSLLPEENENQVDSFLARHPEYKLAALPEGFEFLNGAPMMRLTPHRHQTDGFFAAVLEKIGAQ